MKTTSLLKNKNIWFQEIPHTTSYTARSLARVTSCHPSDVVKTVLLDVDGDFVLALLQADHSVSLKKVRRELEAGYVGLAKEWDTKRCFADCETGAIPPFGSQYGLLTIVDEPLTFREDIVFEANSHREAIRMKYEDFERIEMPFVASITRVGHVNFRVTG